MVERTAPLRRVTTPEVDATIERLRATARRWSRRAEAWRLRASRALEDYDALPKDAAHGEARDEALTRANRHAHVEALWLVAALELSTWLLDYDYERGA